MALHSEGSMKVKNQAPHILTHESSSSFRIRTPEKIKYCLLQLYPELCKFCKEYFLQIMFLWIFVVIYVFT